MFASVSQSFEISPVLAIGQLLSIGLVIAIFVFVKRSYGFSGVLIALSLIGVLCAGYHGFDRLNNYESVDDVAGALLLGIGIFALLGLACYVRISAAKNKE